MLLPGLVYLVLFAIVTWPWITHFNSGFLTDSRDGYQNVWNMWWINKSVTQLHVSPWHTDYLHAPFGVTLIGQTLNPINGFTGIVLQKFLSLTQAFNVMIIFAFVFGGVTMFWLCRFLTRRTIPSLIGGAVFTFSSYHFAHAVGHMQLVTLEFIPLYVLLWWRLLVKPSYRLASGAAVTLLLVLFSDYYYFLYSIIMSAFIAAYLLWRRDVSPSAVRRNGNWRPLLLFAVLCLCLVAPLPVALLLSNQSSPLTGAHNALTFSTDLATPFVDGGLWTFGGLTRFYYRNVRGYLSETTIYLGLTVWSVVAVTAVRRQKIHRDVVLFLTTGAFFGVMSLGPRLLVAGHSFHSIPLPYAALEAVVPGLKLSGVPVRMMLMVVFSAAVLCAMAFAKLDLKHPGGLALTTAFCGLLAIEVWPSPLPVASTVQPDYVIALKHFPAGAVLDDAAAYPALQLFHQTAHEHKLVFGYISRTPAKLIEAERPLMADIAGGRFSVLCHDFQLRYITTPSSRPLDTSFPVIYRDSQALIYDVRTGPQC